MDDSGWTWPAWKFGMRRDELFTTLHDQYNTFPSTIQDPDAFHHDVYEISNEASTASEFHSLMAGRKAQRLAELNESLESASFEIIANPALVGTTQWEHALQLFRTRSLDSLVRYFASYLPADHPWHREIPDASPEQDRGIALFDDRGFTEEPPSYSSTTSSSLSHDLPHDLPHSPRSLTLCSDNSDSIRSLYEFDSLTPRTSFSSSESDHYIDDLKRGELSYHDDASSQSSGPETPTSVSEIGEDPERDNGPISVRSPIVEIASGCTDDDVLPPELPLHIETCLKTPAAPTLSPSSKTATPVASCTPIFFDMAKPTPLSTRHRSRSLSPSRAYHLTDVAAPASETDCRKSLSAHRPLGRPSRLDYESATQRGRQSPRCLSTARGREVRHHEAASRVQKIRPMQTRLRERREREASENRCQY